MKRIVLTALLALNTSIASAAIQFYTFTGTVIGAGESINSILTYNSNDPTLGASMGWANALTGDAVSYTVAIDFASQATATYPYSSPPRTDVYVDEPSANYFYADFVAGSNDVSLINGGADKSDNNYSSSLNVGFQNDGYASMLLGDSSEVMQFHILAGNDNNFALGATWQGNEQSYGYVGDDNASASVVSYLTLTSISPVSPVPEPSTLALMLAGFGLIGFKSHRRNKLSA